VFWLTYSHGASNYLQLSKRLASLGITNKVVAESYSASFSRGHSRLCLQPPFKRALMIAKYLVARYKPVVICVEDDMSPRYLHDYLRSCNILLINLAHSPTGSTEQFSSLFYDYYFCFGPLSLIRLFKKSATKELATQCRFVPSGSPWWQKNSALEKRPCKSFSVGLVGSYFHSSFHKHDRHKLDKLYQKYYNLVADNPRWAFFYKSHVVDNKHKLSPKLLSLSNVTIFSGSMLSLASISDIVVMPPSASSIECAAMRTPYVIIEWNDNPHWIRNSRSYLKDSFYFDRFGIDDDINAGISNRLSDDSLTHKLEKYFRLHIARDDSIDFIAEKLKAIVMETF
jgi:hypothetical protein